MQIYGELVTIFVRCFERSILKFNKTIDLRKDSVRLLSIIVNFYRKAAVSGQVALTLSRNITRR